MISGRPGPRGAAAAGSDGGCGRCRTRGRTRPGGRCRCPPPARRRTAVTARPSGAARFSAALAGVGLQPELGLEGAVGAEHADHVVVRLGDVDLPVRADRDAAGVAERAVARLGAAERQQLRARRRELVDLVPRGVARAGHPEVAGSVERDAGRGRHGDRADVAARRGELLDPVVVLVGDVDGPAAGRHGHRDRLVKLGVAAALGAEAGQPPAAGRQLDDAVVAGVRDPDVARGAERDAFRLVETDAGPDRGERPAGGGELGDPVARRCRWPRCRRPRWRRRRRGPSADARRSPAGRPGAGARVPGVTEKLTGPAMIW